MECGYAAEGRPWDLHGRRSTRFEAFNFFPLNSSCDDGHSEASLKRAPRRRVFYNAVIEVKLHNECAGFLH